MIGLMRVFMPPDVRDSGDISKVRRFMAIIASGVLASGAITVWTLVHAALRWPEVPPDVIGPLTGVLASIIGLIALRHGFAPVKVLIVSNCATCFFLVWGAFYAGGLSSPHFIAIFSGFAMTMLIGDPRTFISLIMGLGLSFAALSVGHFTNLIQITGGPWYEPSRAVALAVLVLYAATVGMLAIGHRESQKRVLREARARAESTLADLEAAKSSLVEQEKLAALGGLVAGISHEVNTPIGVAVTAASALRDSNDQIVAAYAKGDLDEESFKAYLADVEQFTRIIEETLARAAKLMGSFKQIAVDAHHGEMVDVAVVDYLEKAIESLRPEAKKGGHRLVVEGDPSIRARLVPHQLWQIASNLVVNALLHGLAERREGTVQVTVYVDRAARNLVLVVADNGIGMTDEVKRKCLDPFFTTKRGRGGSGLGLSIVNSIVTGLGGSVSIESSPGRGAAFIVRLPGALA